MEPLLTNKTAIVTGGANGQGRATCLLFAEEGAKVVVADRDFANARSTADEIKLAGGEAVAVEVDISKEDDIKKMVSSAVDTYGRIDILFNNAGIGVAGSVTDVPMEEWDHVIAVDLRGPVMGCKYVIPVMIGGGGGVILNNASQAALRGMPAGSSGVHAYTAAKGGIVSLTRALACTYGPNNIRVNCIAPGVIETAMTGPGNDPSGAFRHMATLSPLGRTGTAKEIATTALFLVSDLSSHITGVTIPVDGGLTCMLLSKGLM
jgi:NAD(P)-dependent dehydrogenase (short-subunit alcohol dehydrogenase family)